MKLLSYLAPAEKLERFEKVWAEREMWADKFDISETKDFNIFIMKTPTMRDNSYLLVDLSDNIEHFEIANILQGVARLVSFTTTRPIFILDKSETGVRLAGELAEKNIRNIICVEDKTEDDIESELVECLSDNGKGFADAAMAAFENSMQQIAIDNTQVKLSLPPGKIVQIAVCGTKQCVGVTTQCLQLADYLKRIGLEPIVVTFDTSFYDGLKLAFDLRENLINVLEFQSTHIALLYPSNSPYNAIVYDFKVIKTEEEKKAFINADIPIVVSTSRAWDLGFLVDVENLIGDIRHFLWLNFSENGEYSAMEKWEKLKNAKISRLPYQPNAFRADDMSFYHANILPQLKEVAGHV